MRGTKPVSCRFPGPWQREGKKGRAWFLPRAWEHLQARSCPLIAVLRAALILWERGWEFPCPHGGRWSTLWVLSAGFQFRPKDRFIQGKGTVTTPHWAKPGEGNSREWIWSLLVCTCGWLVLCLKIQSVNKSFKWKQKKPSGCIYHKSCSVWGAFFSQILCIKGAALLLPEPKPDANLCFETVLVFHIDSNSINSWTAHC